MNCRNTEATTSQSPDAGVCSAEGRPTGGMLRVLVLHDRDNVATCMAEMKTGNSVEVTVGKERRHLSFRETIPFGHKVSLCDLDGGDEIVKYGEVIGRASRAIKAGEHVHVHNVESIRARGDRQ